MTQITQLSEREKEVVKYLLQGKSNKLIAVSLGISDRTVEFHLKNIYIKYQVNSRVELILKLGYSTVDNLGENVENRGKLNSQINWATPFKETISIIGKESNMKNKWMFQIANSILWAAAIIASAIVNAPSFLSSILLPVLAVVSLIVMESKLNNSV